VTIKGFLGVCAIGALAWVQTPAYAQQPSSRAEMTRVRSRDRFAQQGTTELSGTAGINLATQSELTIFTFSFQPNVGYFVADGLELSLSPGFAFSAGDVDSAVALYMLAGPSYHFDMGSNVFPFVGLVGGIVEGILAASGPTQFASDVGDLNAVFGTELGLKIALGSRALLRPQLQLLFRTSNPLQVNISAQIGAGLYF